MALYKSFFHITLHVTMFATKDQQNRLFQKIPAKNTTNKTSERIAANCIAIY